MNNHIGGLVNVIPKNKIFSSKTDTDIPEKVLKITNFLKFPNFPSVVENKMKLFGSYFLRIQPYFGDFDTLNFVKINEHREKALKIIVEGIKTLVEKIEKKNGWFCTDIKAGRYPNFESIHWTPNEILQGLRIGKIPDLNGHVYEKNITLEDAINQDPDFGEGLPLLKIDMIAPYYDKYIECTAVYIIDCIDWKFYPKNIGESKRILGSLLTDTQKQLKKNKYFKVVKRLFAMLRMSYLLYNDKDAFILVKTILPIIGSNISKLSNVAGDLSTLNLLFELNKPVNVAFATQQIQKCKDAIANLIDLNINIKKIDIMLDNVTNLLRYQYSTEAIIDSLNDIIDAIQEINKNEINEYFSSINMSFEYFIDAVFKNIKKYL